ncbi:hypothetical protein BT93_G1727 [Corymbia citriodora subsp. variegata]|nr:hypothetical protein BT93_G1727 [Corymbia citriodora subsp. variegata]
MISARGSNVEDSGSEFPGFQMSVHKDVHACRRPMSRLRQKAPCPLPLKPQISLQGRAESGEMGCGLSLSMSSSSSSSFYQNKDPIPLLSPLVMPSLMSNAAACASQDNATRSH